MTFSKNRWQIVWITGGSSGIGREVALMLAERGVKVAVTSRPSDKLDQLVDLSPNIWAFPADVSNREAVHAAVQQIESDLGPIDLAIFSAGLWKMTNVKAFDADTYKHLMDVNYFGVVNALDAVLPAMLERRRGHIAPISSVAGYRGLPNVTGYGASKSAVIHLAESLKLELARQGIDISIINPGYVETPMTEVNEFPMPHIVSAKDAATRILTGLDRKKFEIAFPWPLVAQLKLVGLLPARLYFWAVKTFVQPGK